MGGYVSKYLAIPVETLWNNTNRKRKHKEIESKNDVQEPARKRLRISGGELMFNAMFVKGMYSDITIVALDQKFHLHRPVLMQSPFFASMLNGEWKESHQQVVEITISDPNITSQAIYILFEFLYVSRVEITEKNITSVMAAASYFNVEPLFNTCSKMISKFITNKNVLDYYDIAEQYGWTSVKESLVRYLATRATFDFKLFLQPSKVNVDLVTAIVKHPAIAVTSEAKLYLVLKMWLCAQLVLHNRTIATEMKKLRNTAQGCDFVDLYFKGRKGKKACLLEEGAPYKAPFEFLRLQSLPSVALQQIRNENIIPHEWLDATMAQQLLYQLRVLENKDNGPETFDPEDFDARCIRAAIQVPITPTPNPAELLMTSVRFIRMDFALSYHHGIVSVTRRGGDGGPHHIQIRLHAVPSDKSKKIYTSPVRHLLISHGQSYELLKASKILPAGISFELLLTSKLDSLAPTHSV